MSEANVDVIRGSLEAFERGDLEATFASAHPEVTAHRFAPLPDPGTWHGIEGLYQLEADWTADFDEFEMIGEEFIDAGDRVIVRIKQRARGHGSGAPVEAEFWFVYTMAGGKWISVDIFDGKNQALEAAGLQE
jgi:ketosteroid isomerase-like protein